MTEDEMMSDLAAADAAGDDQLAQHIAGRIKAARQPQPGLASRALQFLGTPFSESINGHPDPLLEKQKQLAVERGPGLVGKDAGNVMAGAGTFVSAMPGYSRTDENPETSARLARFREEHPKTAIGLGFGGGMASPTLPNVANEARALPAATNAFRKAAESTLTPTAEAAFLRGEGVPLTVGQLNPRSAVGQIEEASTSLRGVGAAIQGQREAAKKGWQQLVMREAHPPGMPQVPPEWKPSDALSAIYEGFKPSYEGVGNELIYPAIHDGAKGVPLQSMGKQAGALELAALDPSVLATDQTRQAVHGFLQHQLTILPERAGAVGRVGVGDLLQVRSNIRDAIRSSVQRQDFSAAQLLSNGEEAITKAVESQASPGIVDALRQTDSKYRAYKVVEDAIARAADSPSGFSPSQLTQSIKASMGKGQFARGAGGRLRELEQAGKTVFESTSPPTGARLLTVGPLGEYVTGPMSFLANRAPQEAAPFLSSESKAATATFLRGAIAAEKKRRAASPDYFVQNDQ
jgi:hypothetical protein